MTALDEQLGDLHPTQLYRHVSSETDGHSVPSDVGAGEAADATTRLRQITYTPRNPHDMPLAFGVSGTVQINTTSSPLSLRLDIEPHGIGSTTNWFGSQTFSTTGVHDLAVQWIWTYPHAIDPPTSYTLTAHVRTSSADLDATLDDLSFSVLTLEGTVEEVPTSAALTD